MTPDGSTGSENAVRQTDHETSAGPVADSKYQAPALKKGLLIIETLATYPAGLSLTEIAKRLHFTVNEIFRMVITLQEQGYIQIGNDEKYRLTLKIFELAHRQQPVHSIVTTALPLMQELANQSLQSCHLAVYYSGRSMIVAQIDSPERWTFSVKVGSIVGLLDTSSGNLMLAFANPPERARMLREHAEVTGTPVADLADREKRWADIRAQGFWSAKSQQTVGVTNLARPIFNQSGIVAAILIVPYLERATPGSEPDLQQVSDLLANTADSISRLMGFAGAQE